VKIGVHVPATQATPAGGVGHCPHVTAAHAFAHSGFVLGPAPDRTQHRSNAQWAMLMAVGHEQHAIIEVASEQSPSV
jgi:hypothetical protein